MRQIGITLIILLFAAGLVSRKEQAPGSNDDDWIFLDNGKLRLGVIKSAGGGIGYLSRSRSGRNLLNHFDRGRLIQQSYYGDSDGSKWADRPWRLNPVQGGDYKGKIPPLLEAKVEDGKLYCKSIPLHWATGEKLEDFEFEQWIELVGDLVRVRFRMTYHGEESHAARHQEIPAVFLDPALSDLVFAKGATLVRERPGEKNEYFDIPEHWAAFVGEDGEGLGVYVPAAGKITTYRFRGGNGSDCSYLAPITTFAFQPGMAFEYEAFFCIGDAEEIRARFTKIGKF